MSSFSEWFRKLGHRLRKPPIPDKFLLPQLACNLENSETRLFKKLVQRGRLAPFYPGCDEPNPEEDAVECPICCMHYQIMNRTRCCGQRLCSECVVQIRIGSSYSNSCCPFCKRHGLDVEISEGKTESEKKEDALEKQRFEECRLRQITATQSNDCPVDEAPREEPRSEDQPVSSPTAAIAPTTPTQRYSQQASLTAQGNSSSSSTPVGLPPVHERTSPGHRQTVSNLSHNELMQCEEYLGVSPEDLGLRLEEFNDLLLEQTLISSMVEMRKAEKAQERLDRSTIANQGASSSQVILEQEDKEEENTTGLRSHSLGHSVQEAEQSEMQEDGRRWSIENVLRHVSNAPLTFLSSLTGGESLEAGEASSSPDPSTEEGDREGIPPITSGSESDAASDDVWRNLLNSLAGFDEVHTEFRMISVRFDDPEIDAVFNPSPTVDQSRQGTSRRPIDRTGGVTGVEMSLKEGPSETVMVEHPDGSMALITVPRRSTETVTESKDSVMIKAMEASDRLQLTAMEAADARLRSLYRRS